ncbi:LacI family DNA-binding transcriptional regulator [Microbacterium sp. cf046]|uniref:LacI family DNA-binding transcriptional regulator n=1 Tax=Microbacterium sp. cf046 TaxID=1761803 RepID=UPI000A4A4850|nr:LacI family DNA-binding transcriptional regulator [Microbacterium sp. cf046]
MVDVAVLAGVSHQTVSRVINGTGNVAPDMRARVEAAIERLRYRRNPAARALATSRSMNIGVVSYGLAQYGPSLALKGIADEARAAGYATSLVSLVDVDRVNMRKALDHLVADSVDGIIILAPIDAALTAIDGLDAGGAPLVIWQPGADEGEHRVVTDEISGARIATSHLLSLGHATVHHVSGPEGWLGTTARLRGWSSALSEHGVVAHPAIDGDWTTPSGYEAGLRLARDARVTAVFAANDQMALGVIKAMTDAGRAVPQEVSVVGFDGVPESAFFRPSLTTVRFDFADVGRRAVDHVLDLMRGADPAAPLRVAPELIVRESSTAVSPPSTTSHNTNRKTRT